MNSSSSFSYFLDQLCLEYYFTTASEDGFYEHIFIPDQPWDFSPQGSILSQGDLVQQDEDVSTFTSGDLEDMSGHYTATFSFKDDVVGEFPEDWTDIYSDSNNYAEVVEEIDGHKNVLHLTDDGSNTYPNVACVYSTPQASQYYEFYYRVSDANTGHYLYFFITEDGGTGNAYFYVKNGLLKNRADSTHTEIGTINSNTWHRIRIYLGAYVNCWIDGVQGGGNMGYHISPTVGFNKFSIYSQSGFSGDIYLDALGFTSDPDYELGDLLEEEESSRRVLV